MQSTALLRPLPADSVSAFSLLGMVSTNGREEIFSSECHPQKQDGSTGHKTYWRFQELLVFEGG